MKRFALSFKGGLARGLAGVGVVRFFQEENIKPHVFAGSSSGAIVAAAAASDMKWDEILDLLCSIKFRNVCSVKSLVFKKSLVDYEKYKKEFNKFTRHQDIENLPNRLIIFATNPETHSRIYIEKGDLVTALIGTSGFPFVFPGAEMNGKRLLDGDLTSSYSAKYLKSKGVDAVIGIGHIREKFVKNNSIMGKFRDFFVPMLYQIQDFNNETDPADLEINYSMEGAGLLHFKELDKYADRAYKETRRNKKQIYKLLEI